MSLEQPTATELGDFADQWAYRVALECPFPGARITVIVRSNTHQATGRADRVARGEETIKPFEGAKP